MQKKGELSRLAVSLLICSLIIILGIIIWIILRGEKDKQEIFDDSQLDLKISQVKKVDDNTLELTLKRDIGEGEFVGLSFAVSDGNLVEVIRVNTSIPENQTGNFSLNFIVLNASKIKSISVTPIYINKEGSEIIGNVQDEYITPNTCSNFCPENSQCGVNGCGMKCGNGCASGYLCLNYKCIKEQSSSGSGGGSGGGGSSVGSSSEDNNEDEEENETICIPKTCTSLGRNCGTVSDGCNNILNCGICSDGDSCNSNGICYNPLTVEQADYYVAPWGNDSNNGSVDFPFATWGKLSEVMHAGDLAYIRGGTYRDTNMSTGNCGISIGCTERYRYWFYNLTGTPENNIRIWAYPGETPIFNLSDRSLRNSPTLVEIDNCNYVHFKGLRVTQASQPTDGSPIYGFTLFESSNNILEYCTADHLGGFGFEVANDAYRNPSINSVNNLFLNCDAYSNADPLSGSPYDGSNGFNIVHNNGVANTWSNNTTFRGCRAWYNSDDGFDFYHSNSLNITLDNCWSFWNGYVNESPLPGQAIGVGFKLGPTTDINLNNVHMYTLTNCIAAENTADGFTANGHEEGSSISWLYNNLAYHNNGFGFFFTWYWQIADILKNNIAYNNTQFWETNDDHTNWIESNNAWDDGGRYTPPNPLIDVTDEDFVNLDVSQLMLPRKSDYSLPDITFGHLAQGSDLIDAGTIISGYHCSTSGAHPGENCREWFGNAPDLGAFESNY